MKKKIKKNIIIITIIIFVIGLALTYAINWAFFDIQRIDGQEYIRESISPNGKYTVTAYLNNGGATTGYAVLGKLKNNENGEIRNIYWQYSCEKADIEWLNNETIKINGQELNIKDDIYDYRRNQ